MTNRGSIHKRKEESKVRDGRNRSKSSVKGSSSRHRKSSSPRKDQRRTFSVNRHRDVSYHQREKKEDNGQRQSNRNCYGNQRPYYRSRYYSNYRNDVKYDGRREHEKRNYPRKSLQKPSGNYYNPLLRNYHDCESNYDPRGRNQYEARLIHHL